jgi:Fe-S cluster assembly iron-binding protein IscA
MDIANSAQFGDTTIEKDGLKIFLEQRAGAMLSGATIDYTEARGFSISNAQSSGSCCG